MRPRGQAETRKGGIQQSAPLPATPGVTAWARGAPSRQSAGALVAPTPETTSEAIQHAEARARAGGSYRTPGSHGADPGDPDDPEDTDDPGGAQRQILSMGDGGVTASHT
jgi:hypothetical protein